MSDRDQRILKYLPVVKAPDAIWAPIEAALDEPGTPKRAVLRTRRWAFVALAVMVLVGLLYWRVAHRSQWIETDAHSRVTVKVGEIGCVELDPGSRLRVMP